MSDSSNPFDIYSKQAIKRNSELENKKAEFFKQKLEKAEQLILKATQQEESLTKQEITVDDLTAESTETPIETEVSKESASLFPPFVLYCENRIQEYAPDCKDDGEQKSRGGLRAASRPHMG